ncbi:hypothetical protein PRUPE_2G080600 [Prunus persica]|uniref:Uncharacterized protein n=1 Tax=Prunus persica TaxID=3760 RepID=A0A251QD09_PRUPE|nr:hypothetical protein PRUPE_2G080600 [Prunus persica]
MMLQHQLMMSRSTSADSGLVPMALSLGNGDFDRSNNICRRYSGMFAPFCFNFARKSSTASHF